MANDANPLATFLLKIQESIDQNTFIKLTLSKNGGRDKNLKNVYGRLVEIKNQPHLSFTLRYTTRDEVKNHPILEGVGIISLWLGEDFLNGDLFTQKEDVTIMYNKKRKPRLFYGEPSQTALPDRQHDRQKRTLIEAENNIYLRELGITSEQGKVVKSGQRKFRQINKYIEIIDNLVNNQPLPAGAHVVDMGAGKGYLTFALYDYLQKNYAEKISITGIELRKNLVELTNRIAQQADFQRLNFIAQDIFQYQPERIDMLIALHACDIATDIALAKGIQARSQIIVVAPCCHKQIRKEMNGNDVLQPILKHGILKERQAEIVTDTIRALLLEANGYKTKVFEFISTEHTAKNVMIVGERDDIKREDRYAEIAALKKTFGIKEHYLEKLLKTKSA
ncbi:MAG: SAM-dependent methyltransferase [Saprospiraceae bacterium]